MANKIFGSIQSFNFHDSIQYLEYWFNPIPKILIQSSTWDIDSIQYLKYWCNPIPEILMQSNTSNIDSIEYLE